MEVHTHTHSPRKKWTHYFWEFLMLFLAVFCGFLAEYQLEHKIEHQREKQYIESMKEDVRIDIQNLDNIIDLTRLQVRGKDTIVQLIGNGINTPGLVNYFYELHWKYVGYPKKMIFAKRTINQLLNAGGLRLIRNKKVSDAIAVYAGDAASIETAHQAENTEMSFNALYASGKLIDIKYLRALPEADEYIRAPYEIPASHTLDKTHLRDFAFTLEMDKENSILLIQILRKQKKLAASLLGLLEKEY